MKRLLIPALLLCSVFAFGQKDSTKKDTVQIPYIVLQKADTTEVAVFLKSGKSLKIEPGYIIQTGLQNQRGEWVNKPQRQLVNEKYIPFKELVKRVL